MRVARVLDSLSRSTALASFTREDLDILAVDEWEAFGDGSGVGDELLAWEKDFFATHIHPKDSILVVGAGTGRDVLPFLQDGHEVTALDITPRALATLGKRANSRGFSVTTIEASIVSAALPPRSFDVVLFSWFCFGYLRSPRERAAALERASSALRPDGRILITYANRPSGWDRGGAVARSLGHILARVLGGVATAPGDHVNLTGTASRPGVFFSHTFRPSEIEDDIRNAGLTVQTHEQPSPTVGRLAVVLR